MATLASKDKDLSQFYLKYSIILGAVLLIELLNFSLIARIVSVFAHCYLLYFGYKLVHEFKSDFPKTILAVVILGLIGEICVFVNPQFLLDEKGFWGFVIIHAIRNLVLSGRLFLNVFKSDIYNDFWLKALPYPCVGILFLLLELFIFGRESFNFLIFVCYNALTCLPILVASLRYNHTSQRGFSVMILGTLALIVSDIFYFARILQPIDDPLPVSFRVTFLLLGNALIIFAAYDHVVEFEKESRSKVYAGMDDDNEIISPKLRGKILATPRKPIEEPLV